MKIYNDLAKENNASEKIIIEIKKNSKTNNIFLNLFDKATFIEKIYESLEKGKSFTFKIDENTSDYPNFLQNSDLPRFVIQKQNGTYELIPLQKYLEKFSELTLEKKGNEYFLTIKKTNDKLDLGLKLDKDKTIDLKWISEDKKKTDTIYFGIRSYYYVRK